ncbi:MAG: hypothetical protein WCW27_03375 [Patescibacteria group bacterium]|jgi:hypothetical protein
MLILHHPFHRSCCCTFGVIYQTIAVVVLPIAHFRGTGMDRRIVVIAVTPGRRVPVSITISDLPDNKPPDHGRDENQDDDATIIFQKPHCFLLSPSGMPGI